MVHALQRPSHQSAENHRIFFVLSSTVAKTVGAQINAIRFISLKLMFERSKLEPLRDVRVTRIGDSISYGFS